MNTNHSETKKRRIQNACLRCRQKKVRCDSGIMPDNICSGCMNAGADCTHNHMKKKRGPKPIPKNGIEKNFEAAQSFVSCILAEPETYPIPKDPDSIRTLIIDISRYTYFLQKELSLRDQRSSVIVDTTSVAPSSLSLTPSLASSPTHDAHTNPYPNDCPSHVEEDPDANTIFKRLEELTLGQQHSRHFGMSSNFQLVKTLLDYKQEATGYRQNTMTYRNIRRQGYWAIYPWQQDIQNKVGRKLTFPDNELLHDLINDYFVYFEPYLPLLHRSTFETSVAEGLHFSDIGFGQVVLAVCAVASRCSRDPRNMPEGTDSDHSLGWRWYSQISIDTSSFIEAPRVYNLQVCVLMVTYLQISAISESSWIILGIAMRLAQAMGMHRKRPDQARTIERESCIRAFWAIIAYDTCASLFLGRPRVTTTDDFDVELPVDCDQEFWNATAIASDMFVQPPDKPSQTSYWIHFIKLMNIAGLVNKLIYPIKKLDESKISGIDGISLSQKAVMELDSALNAWVGSIPDQVKWDPKRSNAILFTQSAMLYTSYYWLQIQVHKKFIPGPGRETILNGFPSLTICVNAARSCINIAEACNITHPTPITLPSVFSAAIVLLINFWRGKKLNAPLSTGTEMFDVHKCFKIIRPFEQRYQGAGRMIDILNAIISVGHLNHDVPLESDSSTHIARDWDPKPSSSFLPKLTEHSNASSHAMSIINFSQQPADRSHEGTLQHTPISRSSLPFYTTELGLLPLYSSGSIMFSPHPSSGIQSTVSTFPEYNSSSTYDLQPASASVTSTELGTISLIKNKDIDPSSASGDQSHPGSFVSSWGPSAFVRSNDIHEDLRNEPDEDWSLFMQNVDDLLQSTADFPMFTEERQP
ncbi:fungal-specific transcription factor domain-containing protein [Lentinula edodes]|nr:fungal-specific transcription factor domain-containing protein [Lentinula edodes]